MVLAGGGRIEGKPVAVIMRLRLNMGVHERNLIMPAQAGIPDDMCSYHERTPRLNSADEELSMR